MEAGQGSPQAGFNGLNSVSQGRVAKCSTFGNFYKVGIKIFVESYVSVVKNY